MAPNNVSEFASNVPPLSRETTLPTLPGRAAGKLISDDACRIFQWIIYSVVLVMINIFGIATNIVNIICFVKQGLKDSVNVSLLGLAISDLASLLTLLGTSICLIPAFQDADLPFDSVEVQYLMTGWPHITFTRVTGCLTALITMERCLSITMPLKVKHVFTSKRVSFIIICIFIFIIGAVSPMYYANRYAWTFSPARNKTMLRLIYTDDRPLVENVTYGIVHIFIPFSSYATVIVCTIVLVIKLRSNTRWRVQCAGPNTTNSLSERDQKVAKMVVMISSLFIACFVPLCFTFIAIIVEPRISIDGQYKNTFYVFGGISVVFEAVNSANNIFIYHSMSTRYRSKFREIFGRQNVK